MLSGADRIRRIRQRIEAASPLAKGASGSDLISVVEGRIARTEDGCCVPVIDPVVVDPYKVAFVNSLSDPIPDPTFTRVLSCTNYEFPMPLPTGTVITFYNNTEIPQGWQVGNGDVGPYYQAAQSSALAADETTTYIKTDDDEVESMNFGNCIQLILFNAPGVTDCPGDGTICLEPGAGVTTFPQIAPRVVIQITNTTGAIDYVLGPVDNQGNISAPVTQGTVGYNGTILYTVGPNDTITGIAGTYKYPAEDPYAISIVDSVAACDTSVTCLETACTLQTFTLPNPDGQSLSIKNNTSSLKTAVLGTGNTIPLSLTIQIPLAPGGTVGIVMGASNAFYFTNNGTGSCP